MLDTCSDEAVPEYIGAARVVQEAIAVAIDPGSDEQSQKMSPENVAHLLDLSRPAVKAAMMDGAISFRGYLYKDPRFPVPIESYTQVWKDTPLAHIAAKCEGELEGIKPSFDGRFTHVSLAEMRQTFDANLANRAPEHIVVTGLNGVGKSTIIDAFSKFTEHIKIKTQVIKFPRPEGPLSSVIKRVLSGKEKLDLNALQMLFLSDALDSPPKHETLVIYDRNPLRDSLVYGPRNGLETTILAAQEML